MENIKEETAEAKVDATETKVDATGEKNPEEELCDAHNIAVITSSSLVGQEEDEDIPSCTNGQKVEEVAGAMQETTASSLVVAGPPLTSKKRSRGDATAVSNVPAAAPILTYNTLLALLYPSSSSLSMQTQSLLVSSGANPSNTTAMAAGINAAPQQLQLHMIPDTPHITTITNKALNDIPPYVHLNTRDANPTLIKMVDSQKMSIHFTGGDYSNMTESTAMDTTIKWALGYRMIRASHGISPPTTAPFVHYYYEVVIASPQPTSAQIKAGLPKNSRIGYGLAKELNLLSKLEQLSNEEYKTITERIHETTNGTSLMLGSHLRLGFSMRTGDLNAPVGYDKWSYGVRDVRGSRIHQSKREDNWGRGYNVSFGPGDVIGCWITLLPAETGETKANKHSGYDTASSTKQQPVTTNHIRFFCNGKSMGALDTIGTKTRTGGEAFDNIASGTYYPAISTYMGGSARVNFGPHFIYNPNKQIPNGKDWSCIRPVTDLSPPPPNPEEAVSLAMKGRNLSKKTEEAAIEKFKDAVRTESGLRYDAYEKFKSRHLEFVIAEREIRGISTEDLPLLPSAQDTIEKVAESTGVEDMQIENIGSMAEAVALIATGV